MTSRDDAYAHRVAPCASTRRCVGRGLVPALLGARDASWLPAPAREAERSCCCVLDGLGWNAIEEPPTVDADARGDGGRPDHDRASRRRPRPRSRRSATGLAPAQHGIVGYRMLVGRDVLNVLRWTVPSGGRPPDPFDVQRHTAFLGREVPVDHRVRVPHDRVHAGAPARRPLRGLAHDGDAGRALRARASRPASALVYAYYPGVDTVAHEFGLHDARVPA